VREFARGIYPPLLESEGLGPALKSRARKVPIPVSIQAAGIGRYSKEHEATVYFCVLEALQNAIKHSGASSIVVTLDDRDGRLGFEVRDDGVGFDTAAVSRNGLINMRDRMEAVGGRVDLDAEPGRGTRIHGSLPLVGLVST
jgi:signal transduction histidine kinase